MSDNLTKTVTGIAFLHEGKWGSLKHVLDAIIRDPQLKKLILVSASPTDQTSVTFFAKMYASKMDLIELSTSSGRALLLAKAIQTVKKEKTDYVLFLGDEAIPEDDFIKNFFSNYKYFNAQETSNVIMIANTIDIFGEEKSFYSSASTKNFKDGTLFDIFRLDKVMTIIRRMLRGKSPQGGLPPVFKTRAFVGEGVLIPMEAIRKAKEPDASLYEHGEDTDYAWNLKEAGYSFFQCQHPILRKPASENRSSHHVFGLFDVRTKDDAVYYHIRNAIIVSKRHTYQSKPVLFLNIISWISLLLIAGFWENDSFKVFFKRTGIILLAFVDGYRKTPLAIFGK